MVAVDYTDPADARLALYRDLKDSALRRRAELAHGVFVVEGKLALEAVLASPYPLRSVLVLRRRLHLLDELVLPPAVTIYGVDEDVMAGRHRVRRPPWAARRGRTLTPGAA